MESVHILAVVDGHDHLLLVDMLGQRQLHDKAVHVLVFVELLHLREQFLFLHVILEADERRSETAGLASQHLVLHVSLRTTIMAHQNGSQMRPLAAGGYNLLHLLGNLFLNLGRSGLSVNQGHIILCLIIYILGIPGIPPFIPFMAPIIFFMPAPVTIFIILRVWSNCLIRRFTS